MEKKQLKNLWKWLIKIAFSGLAIWWVSQKINFSDAFLLVSKISPLYLLGGIVFFNLSKVVSAFRLTIFFNNIGLRLDNSDNIALYYKGMFYNLFLPGGIGGDGYKIYALNKQFKTPVKQLFHAILFDRISGLGGLITILLGLLLTTLYFKASTLILVSIGLVTLLVYPIHYLVLRIIGKNFTGSFVKTCGLSAGVQLLQIISAWLLLKGLSVTNSMIEYLISFLVSSVATIIPLTVGGLGAREMAFVLLAPYMAFNTDIAVAFSLVFFLIAAGSSIPGIFLPDRKEISSFPI